RAGDRSRRQGRPYRRAAAVRGDGRSGDGGPRLRRGGQGATQGGPVGQESKKGASPKRARPHCIRDDAKRSEVDLEPDLLAASEVGDAGRIAEGGVAFRRNEVVQAAVGRPVEGVEDLAHEPDRKTIVEADV